MMFHNTNSTGKMCCIPHCITNEAENENTVIQFYSFPVDPILKEMWMERVRKAGTGNKWFPKSSSRLCGIHFSSTGQRDSCDILPRYFGSKVYPHSGITSVDEVQVKLEVADDDIEIHEEPLAEEFFDFSHTDAIKQETKDVVDKSSEIKLPEKNHFSVEPHNHQHDLLMPLAKIEEKIKQIKRNKPPITGKVPPKKQRVIILNQLQSENTHLMENASLKHQISILEQSLTKANTMIKERKEIIMNLVKEINKLKQQTGSQTELSKENMHLQDSLMAANRRINEEKELIVNLTIENINLKKNAAAKPRSETYSEFCTVEHCLNDELAHQIQLVETLRQETKTLSADIQRLNRENGRLVLQNADMVNLREGKKKLSKSNEFLQANLAKARKKVSDYKKELNLAKSNKECPWSDREIKYYTGFPGKSEFKEFCNIAKGIDPTAVSESYDKSKIRLQIFITLSRIRQGLDIEDLSNRYDLSQGTIIRILNHWQCILSDSSFNWKICDSQSVIIKFFYEYFQDRNKRRMMCYFVGISPFGYVIFVSDLFLPSEDRKEVLRSSGILSLLEEGFMIGALETDEFSELGIGLLNTNPEESSEFHRHSHKLLLSVRTNKLFSHVLPSHSFSEIDVSKAWQISWYLQNYIDES